MVSDRWRKENDLSDMLVEIVGAAKILDRLTNEDRDIDDVTYFVARSLERLEHACQTQLEEISQCLGGKTA